MIEGRGGGYHKAIAPIAVVQFGLAISGAPTILRPLISGTTNGMSGSYLDMVVGWWCLLLWWW